MRPLRRPPRSAAAAVIVCLLAAVGTDGADGPPREPAVTPAEVLAGLRAFWDKTARADGSYRPGVDPDYQGMSDSALSDLAPTTYAVTLHRTLGLPLAREARTREWLLGRQREDGAFVNVEGTADPKSPLARLYNTTQGLVALHALGARPRYDPLPVFADLLREDYRRLPLYATSFYPLAYRAAGKPMPADADRKLRSLTAQAEDGYVDNHVAATFHMVHYCRLQGRPTPKADAILRRVLADQKPDGGWLRNPPARDRHAAFDAVFVIRQLGKGHPDAPRALRRAVGWALRCRNPDGGFGHFPGSPSDADAVYFQVGILVMGGFLPVADPPPPDPELLSWGHQMPPP